MNAKSVVWLACLALGMVPIADARTWTDKTGKHTVEAELVQVADGQVHLKKPDGSIVAVPVERLSDADQRYLRSLSKPAPAEKPAARKPSSKSGRRAAKNAPLKTGRAAIEQELAKRTTYDFQETPLREVLTQLEDTHQLPIFLDGRGVVSAGVRPGVPVTAHGGGHSLEEALAAILTPLKLTWLVRDEVLFVTSREQAAKHLETRVYKVLRPVAKPDEFLQEIADKVAPKSWDTAGGPGAIRAWPLGAVIVSQSYAVHRELEQQYGKLLQLLPADPRLVRRPPLGRPTLKDILTQPCVCEFEETPLATCLRRLGDQFRVKLALDEQTLEAAGLRTDAPITCRLRDVKLECALTLVLEQLGLLWTVRDDQLVVTTPAGDAAHLRKIEYNVRDLIYATPGQSELVANLVLTMVRPQSWSQAGGPATMKVAEDGGVLEIKHTFRAHLEVDRLLSDLRLFGKS